MVLCNSLQARPRSISSLIVFKDYKIAIKPATSNPSRYFEPDKTTLLKQFYFHQIQTLNKGK